ncbi:MAG: PAS domain-containing protein, partial [Pseudolabrys sp.]
MPNDAPFVDMSSDAPFNAIENGITLAHAIVDTVRDPLLVLDQDLRIVAASRSFYQAFQLVRQDVLGHLLYGIDGGQWNIPELRGLLEAIVKDDATVEGHVVDREFPRVGRRIMRLSARKLFYEEGTHNTTLLAFEDITHRRA